MVKEIHYKVGQKIEIENSTWFGMPMIEGVATLKRFISKEQTPPYAEWWKVEFPDDKGTLVPRRIIIK